MGISSHGEVQAVRKGIVRQGELRCDVVNQRPCETGPGIKVSGFDVRHEQEPLCGQQWHLAVCDVAT